MSGAAEQRGGVLRCVLWHAPGAVMPGDLLTSLSKRIGRISVCTDGYAAMAEACALSGDGGGGIVLLIVQPERLSDAAEVVTELRTYAPAALCWKFDSGANPKLAAVVDTDVTTWAARGASAAAGSEQRLGVARISPSSSSPPPATTPATTVSSPFSPAVLPRRAPAAQASHPPHPSEPPALRLADQDVPTARPRVPERVPEIVVRPQPRRAASSGPPELKLRGEMPAEPGLPASPQSPPAPVRPVLTAEEMRMLLSDDPIDDLPGKSNGHAPKPGSKPEGERS